MVAGTGGKTVGPFRRTRSECIQTRVSKASVVTAPLCAMVGNISSVLCVRALFAEVGLVTEGGRVVAGAETSS